MDCIGSGFFRHAGDGPTWVSFSGEINIDESVKVGGFKASGLNVKDVLLLTMTPPDLQKSAFMDLRQSIPIRLTTDPWTTDGTGIGLDRDTPDLSDGSRSYAEVALVMNEYLNAGGQ